MKALLFALFATALTSRNAFTRATAFDGTFALQGGSARATGHLAVQGSADPLARRLTIWMTAHDARSTIVRYDVDMTKRMHVVIVSDDFTTFLHVHPRLGADGHFTLEQRFPRPGLYRIYADALPHGLGQQVFRFDVPVGAGGRDERRLRATGATVRAGSYRVTLSTTSLHAGGESGLTVRVLKGNALAPDMQPYLGASAHAVFLDARDLTYVHVHPTPRSRADMAMPMTMLMAPERVATPDMALHVGVDEPGTYALWFQFRAGGRLHVAPFVVTAR